MRDFFKALLMGLFEPTVQICVNNNVAHDTAHGVIHGEDRTGKIQQHKFMADAPKYLKRPSEEILTSLFRQAEALGLQPRHVEIFVGQRRLYDQTGRLLFSQ